MKLRPYQLSEIKAALGWLNHAGQADRRIAVAPTGTGKGTIKVALLSLLTKTGHGCVLLSPSMEIVRGLRERAPEYAEKIYTPIKFLNTLEKGEIARPLTVIVDEAHEWVPSNQIPQRICSLLPVASWLGYTATPYRATALGTGELLQLWGKPREIISLKKAIAGGYYAMPAIRAIPLIDDDGLSVVNGSFVADDVNEFMNQQGRLETLATLITELQAAGAQCIVSAATTKMGYWLSQMSECSEFVNQKTPVAEREAIYAASRRGEVAIIQLGVLYRGADLPWLDTLIDAQPTMSATRWMQTVGRITRPPGPKSLIITNRNFERHGFLLSGALPREALSQLEMAWEQSGSLYPDLSRWLGFERTRKTWYLRRASGRILCWYRFTFPMDGYRLRSIGVLVCPSTRAVLWGTRKSVSGEHGWKHGRWNKSRPEEISGLRSAGDNPPSRTQLRTWEIVSKRVGLVGQPSCAEQVTALRFVTDLNLRFN